MYVPQICCLLWKVTLPLSHRQIAKNYFFWTKSESENVGDLICLAFWTIFWTKSESENCDDLIRLVWVVNVFDLCI